MRVARPRALLRRAATTAAAASRTGSRSTTASASQRLALLDIAPTLDMYERDRHALRARLLPLVLPDPAGAAARDDDRRRPARSTCTGSSAAGARTASAIIEPEALAEYERCFCRAEAIHAACEDYRAARGIDLEHDRASRAAARRSPATCSCSGARAASSASCFDPLALWRRNARREGRPAGRARAGHFIPEELPERDGAALRDFFALAALHAFPTRFAGPAYHRATREGSSHVRLARPARSRISRSATRPGCCASSASRRARSRGCGMDMDAWLAIVFLVLSLDRRARPARRQRHAILRNYPVIGASALPLRVHPARDPPVLHRGRQRGGAVLAPAALARLPARQGRARTSGPFGTQLDVYAAGYEWINHSLQPTRARRRTTSASTSAPAVRAAVLRERLQHLGDELRRAVGATRSCALNAGAQARQLRARHRRGLDQPLPPRARRRPDLGDRLGLLRLPRRRRQLQRGALRRQRAPTRRSR